MSSAPQPICQIVDVTSDLGGVATLLNSSQDFCAQTASSQPAKLRLLAIELGSVEIDGCFWVGDVQVNMMEVRELTLREAQRRHAGQADD